MFLTTQPFAAFRLGQRRCTPQGFFSSRATHICAQLHGNFIGVDKGQALAFKDQARELLSGSDQSIMKFIAEAEDKAAAFAFCQERMQADITTEAPRLKEMCREIDAKLRRMGGTGSMQLDMRQEALDYIRIAQDREEAFGEVVKGIDIVLELSRSPT